MSTNSPKPPKGKKQDSTHLRHPLPGVREAPSPGESPSRDFLSPDSDNPAIGHGKNRQGARAINTPVVNVDRRFFPRDMRGLLEIYEQGTTLQQDMKSHCKDTTCAMDVLAEQCEHTVKILTTKMEDIMLEIKRQVDRPANVDWTCVMTALAKIDRLQPAAIGEDVTQRLNVHQQGMLEWQNRMEGILAAKIEGMDGSLDRRQERQDMEMEKLREEVKAAQQLSTNIGEAVKVAENDLKEAFANQHRALKTDFAQSVQDVLRLQEKNRRADMAQVEPLLDQQLEEKLNAHHQHLKDSVAKTIEDISHVQKQHKSQMTEIVPLVTSELEKQFEMAHLAGESPRVLIKDIHKTLHDDIGHLYNEIAKIQKAMNLEYIVNPRSKLELGADQLHYREFWTQTECSRNEASVQTDDAYLKQQRKREKLDKQPVVAKEIKAKKVDPDTQGNRKKSGFADQEAKKAKMREALIKPSYNVANFYHTTGCFQAIARSAPFENVTFLVIIMNAIWISVDTDHNDALVLIDAHPVFQASENLFCAFFTAEWLIRFLAFRNKRDCVKDFWFVFDLVLLSGMIAETWIISIVLLSLGGGGGANADGISNLSILRMARLVKMVRMARMARLLRMVPELVMILKSIGAAFRSVSFFVLLALIIVYVYGVALRQMTKDTDLGEKYFPSVPKAMDSLLLYGMLPIYAQIIGDVSAVNPLFWPIIMSFIFLASLTVMNMLVGVLVEVVRTVAERERDAMTVIHVTNVLREVMQNFNHDNEGRETTRKRSSIKAAFTIKNMDDIEDKKNKLEEDLPDMSKDTLEHFLGYPGVAGLLQDCGVDAVTLLDSLDLIYDEKVKLRDDGGTGLRFVDFVDVVLNMRGTNPATVKDLKEQMRLVKSSSYEYAMKTQGLLHTMIMKLRGEVMLALHDLRRLVDSDMGSDDGVPNPYAYGSRRESFQQEEREYYESQHLDPRLKAALLAGQNDREVMGDGAQFMLGKGGLLRQGTEDDVDSISPTMRSSNSEQSIQMPASHPHGRRRGSDVSDYGGHSHRRGSNASIPSFNRQDSPRRRASHSWEPAVVPQPPSPRQSPPSGSPEQMEIEEIQ